MNSHRVHSSLTALALLFIACAPAVNAPRFEAVGGEALAWTRDFADVLEYHRISFTAGQLYHYSGNDDKAFLAAVDGFYLEMPGYCPIKDGYHVAPIGALQMTLAAKGSGVRALIYDLSRKPAFTYAILAGSSQQPLPVTPCRTATK